MINKESIIMKRFTSTSQYTFLVCFVFLFALLTFKEATTQTLTRMAPPYFFFSAEGAFVEQFRDGTGYALFDYDSSLGDFSTKNRTRYINPTYKVSWGGEIGKVFRRNMDVRFRFFLHNHSVSDSITAPNGGILYPLLISPHFFGLGVNGFAAGQYNLSASSARSVLYFNINSFSLILGKMLLPFRQISVRPYVGVALSRLKIKQQALYDLFDGTEVSGGVPVGGIATANESASITGIGPIIGAELDHMVFKKLSIMIDIDLAMLLGKANSSYFSDVANINGGPYYISNRVWHSFERVNLKLALKYQQNLKLLSTYFSRLECKVGYRFAKYFNAIISNISPDPINFSLLLQLQEKPGFQGPFLSLTLFGKAAH